MNKYSNNGLLIAGAAVGLGIAGDSLLRTVPWGLNVPIMGALCVGALVFLKLKIGKNQFTFREYALLAAALFFASWFAIRDSEPLLVLNAFAILLIGAILLLPALKLPIKGSGVVHYALSGIAMGLSMALLPAVVLTKDLRWDNLAKGAGSKKAILAVRGILIAAPLVLVFGALFAAADAAFEGLVTNTFDVVPQELALHAFFTAFFAWPAAGYLRALTLGASIDGEFPEAERAPDDRDFSEGGIESVTEARSEEVIDPPAFGERHIPSITAPESEGDSAEEAPRDEPAEKKVDRTWSPRDLNNSLLPGFLTVGSVEVGIVLGSLNLLFLTFVFLQLPYLFGGMDLVQNQPGLKLAEYARRGFGELFFASMLVLPILLALHWLIRRESERALSLFRYLAAIQIGLLFVIMMSAFQRMILYTGELGYGMTAERFFPMAFMIWLAVVFLLFGYTVLRGRRSRFAWNAAVSGLAMVAVLNFINPEDYIVRTNLGLMNDGRDFDAVYNSSLSADAAPALVEAFPELNAIQQNEILYGMTRNRCFNPPLDDLRVWNFSRRRFQASGFYRYSVLNADCSDFGNVGFD
ncbi:MAG: DUF4173 domain-containing protein [Aridibacter famidurans]|nr:DUF4173 domain-containing protein [Aridibacter famidurans]